MSLFAVVFQSSSLVLPCSLDCLLCVFLFIVAEATVCGTQNAEDKCNNGSQCGRRNTFQNENNEDKKIIGERTTWMKMNEMFLTCLKNLHKPFGYTDFRDKPSVWSHEPVQSTAIKSLCLNPLSDSIIHHEASFVTSCCRNTFLFFKKKNKSSYSVRIVC